MQLRQLFLYIRGFAVVGINFQYSFEVLAGQIFLITLLVRQPQVIMQGGIFRSFGFIVELDGFLEKIDCRSVGALLV